MISFHRYRAVFAVPGMTSTFWISMLGRLPIGITGLAILLLVQAASASFARGARRLRATSLAWRSSRLCLDEQSTATDPAPCS